MADKPLVSFDYAIKYLLKDKGNYDIIEGFLSALLKSQWEINKNVKIIALLDTESNKEDPMEKRSLADLIVEDEDHNKYIIEIERSLQQGFIHKACFNTSRLIVDNLAEGSEYSNIVKVIHISILYFKVGNEPIHHGETVIKGLESKERLNVHIKDPETNMVVDATNILPEYFFISVPLFDDHLEKEIDDWLYVMKHDNVPQQFHSPYMERVRDKLSILKMTASERNEYYAYKKKVHTDTDSMFTAIEKGREEGIKEGMEKGREEGLKEGMEKGIEKGIEKGKEIAVRNMLKAGISADKVYEITGFSIDSIEKLESENHGD